MLSSSKPVHGGAGAELAAYNICKKPLDLTGRKKVVGYAIDSADPDSPMDRDDAINIRFGNDPKHGRIATLDVSIADVASISPCAGKNTQGTNLSTLDEFAFKNGESLYFAHGVSPMLPRRLQDRLSLDNGKERPAITISVTFNQQGQPIHTEFARTSIKTKCLSYREAAREILIYGNPIQKISVVANQLLHRKSNVTNLPHYDEKTGTYTDAEGNSRHISGDEVSAFSTVQGAMIAANEAAAQLMSGCPFLFRNHSYSFRNSPAFYNKKEMETFENREGKVIQNKAEYSQVCHGHFGIDAEKYSHVTSPMRRYADLVNQRMIGWAIDVVEATTNSIVNHPSWDSTTHTAEKISYVVWNHASELLEKASTLKKSGTKRLTAEKEMKQAIVTTITDITGADNSHAVQIAETVLQAISDIEPPYTTKRLGEISTALNKTLAKNRLSRRQMQLDESNRWLDRVFPLPDAGMLRHWSSDTFARLLEAAAYRGDNHDVFATEVSLRLQDDKETLVQNLYSILVIAQRHKDSHWQELKRQAFQMLKNDPELGEKVFAYMQKQREPAPHAGDETAHREGKHTTRVYILEATMLNEHKTPHPSALVVLTHDDKDYSAPIIDTADTPEKARQAAVLTFFRHYGDLYPHQELYTPKLIDLALERAKVRKGGRLKLLKKMCVPHFNVDVKERDLEAPSKNMEVEISVTSHDGAQTMVKTRSGSQGTPDQIIDKTAKDIMEDRRFLDMLSQYHIGLESDGQSASGTDAMPKIIWSDSAMAERFIDRRPPAQR